MSEFDTFPLFPDETYYNTKYLSEFDEYSLKKKLYGDLENTKQKTSLDNTSDLIKMNGTPAYDIEIVKQTPATLDSRNLVKVYPDITDSPDFSVSKPNTQSGFNGGINGGRPMLFYDPIDHEKFMRRQNRNSIFNEDGNIVLQPIVFYFLLFIIFILIALQYKCLKTIKKIAMNKNNNLT